MNTADLEKLPTNEIAEIVSAGAAILAKRAGAVARPTQLSLLPAPSPIDPAAVDFEERLSNGKLRYVFVKDAAITLRMSEDALIARSKRDGIGFQIGGPGGKWMIDMKRVSSRA